MEEDNKFWGMWTRNFHNAKKFFNSKGNSETLSRLKDKWHNEFIKDHEELVSRDKKTKEIILKSEYDELLLNIPSLKFLTGDLSGFSTINNTHYSFICNGEVVEEIDRDKLLLFASKLLLFASNGDSETLDNIYCPISLTKEYCLNEGFDGSYDISIGMIANCCNRLFASYGDSE